MTVTDVPEIRMTLFRAFKGQVQKLSFSPDKPLPDPLTSSDLGFHPGFGWGIKTLFTRVLGGVNCAFQVTVPNEYKSGWLIGALISDYLDHDPLIEAYTVFVPYTVESFEDWDDWVTS